MILDPIPHKEVVTEVHIPLTEGPSHLEGVITTPVIQDLLVEIDMMIGDKVDMIGFEIEIIDLVTIVLAIIDSERMIISPIVQEMASPTDLLIALNMDIEMTVQTQAHRLDPPLDFLLDLLPLVSIGVNPIVSHSCARKRILTVTQKSKG